MPLNFSPDAIKNNEAEQARFALQELKAQIIAEQTVKTREKINENTLVLTAEDFANKTSQLIEKNLDTIPQKIKDLAEKLIKMKTREEVEQYFAENGQNFSREELQQLLVVLEKKRQLFMKYASMAGKEAEDARSKNGQKTYERRLSEEEMYDEKASFNETIQYIVEKQLNKFNLPQDSEKIDPKIMDPVFEEILQNPKFAGTVKNNPELNQLVFNAFPPQFQKRFKELNLKVEVKKYGERIFVYFVCGTDKNGKEYKVVFVRNFGGAKNVEVSVLNDPKYGKVLAQTDDEGMIQEIREISPTELEQRDLDKNGEISFSIIITKNPISTEKVANN